MQVLLGHGIRLGDNGDQIDTSPESLHHLDIKRLDTDCQLSTEPTITLAYVVPGLIK